MKLGDIKIEALKMMGANVNEDIYPEYLSDYMNDESYKEYLINMTGAINRCFSSLEEKRVLPTKARVLTLSEGLASNAFVRFDLANLIEDFYDIDRIVRETSNGDYDADHEYIREGDTLVLDRFEENDGISYTVIYHPSIQRITSSTDNETELSIPDSIASYIPYFIKGELYRGDEPNEASEARNWYEQAMAEISSKKIRKTNGVRTVYSQTED